MNLQVFRQKYDEFLTLLESETRQNVLLESWTELLEFAEKVTEQDSITELLASAQTAFDARFSRPVDSLEEFFEREIEYTENQDCCPQCSSINYEANYCYNCEEYFIF